MSSAIAEILQEEEEIHGLRLYRPLLDAMTIPNGDHYQDHLKDFEGFMAMRDGDVDLGAVRDYFISLGGKGYAANTIRIKRQGVKARMRVAMSGMDFNQQAVFEQAIKKLDRDTLTRAPKIQQAPISGSKVIKRRDFDRLLEAATARDRLLLRFLWVTGCRVSELTGARLDAIKAEGEIAFIRIIGKGSKERTLRIKISLLEEIRAEFKGSTFLFETAFRTDKDGKTTGGRPFSRVYVSTRVHDLCRRVLNRSLGSHSLRHSFATRKILAGKAVKAVSVYLGHSSTSITQDMYVSAELSDADLLGDDED